MRPIDADALEELFLEVIGGIAKKPEMNGNLEHMIRASAMVIEMIQDAPTIEPERKTGRWMEHYAHEDGERDGVACSECRTHFYFGGQLMNFCPNCGADMRGETNE